MKNWSITPEHKPGWTTPCLCFSLFAEVNLQGAVRSSEIMCLSSPVQLHTSKRINELVELLNCIFKVACQGP